MFQDPTTLHFVQLCLLRLGRPRHLTFSFKVRHHWPNTSTDQKRNTGCRKVSYKAVDLDRLISTLQTMTPPIVDMGSDALGVEAAIVEGDRGIIEDATSHIQQGSTDSSYQWDQTHPRCKRLLDTNDTKLIWKSIN